MIEVKREIKDDGICEFLTDIENQAKHTDKTLTLDFIGEGKRARTVTDSNGQGGITKAWEIDEDGNLVREIGDKIAMSLWWIG